tara:strand:- start:2229 stop:3557 length:1329 start_codon:yes stop_codon:yes gene_type:complete
MTTLYNPKMRRAAITTLGCKINTYESAVISQSLQDEKWTVVSSRDVADLYIINSCTVTAEAGRQTRQEIRRAIKRNPEATVVVTGCYAEMEPEQCYQIPGVDLVINNSHKLSLVKHINHYSKTNESANRSPNEKFLTSFPSRTRAFIQIQQGCDQSCTYCVIHKARGPSQSFSQGKIKQQVEILLEEGYKEIVICGIDLGSWGYDFKKNETPDRHIFLRLLEDLSDYDMDYRIRLSSIDPAHLDDDLIDLIASSNKICPHLHVSMQSANSLILKRMKRRYDAEELYKCVLMAHKKINNLVLSADLMVGFPTETEEHFQDTLNAVDDLMISYPHVFPYSERKGTPAAKIPSQVPKNIRKERSERVRNAGYKSLKRVLDQHLGSAGRILIEAGRLDGGKKQHGRLDNYLPVYLLGSTPKIGKFIDVEIKSQEKNVLIARRRCQA